MASAKEGSTRVFVSNLPRSFSSEQLASHFRKTYNVTDAHVFPDRRIGFVGFHDPTTAQDAANHFNRTFIRMSKISVDLAKPIELNRDGRGQAIPISKRGFQSTLADGKSRDEYAFHPADCVNEPRKRKRERNDDGEVLRAGNDEPASVPTPLSKSLPQPTTSGQHIHMQEAYDTTMTVKESDPQVLTSDNDWLRGKTNRVLDLLPPDQISSQTQLQGDQDYAEAMESSPHSQSLEVRETDDHEQGKNTAISNARLFIRNLAFDVTAGDLEAKFGEFGKVQESHIVLDPRTATSKGMAFIQFSNNEEAETALHGMDGVAFRGRLLHVLPAASKRESGLTEYEISKMPIKKQKAIRRKLESSTATFTWNSLYMNPDAVITSIANRLGVAKSDILDPTSADAAVKQAHAETQLIAETKDYLQTQGVHAEAFKNQKRDARTILLKNFPFGISEIELRALLEPYGQLMKLIIPPAGTIAIAQFSEPYSASQALKALAYKNIKGSVLYLEKAPEGLLPNGVAESLSNTVAHPEISAPISLDGNELARGASATVFIRNLNFETSTSRLRDTFSPLSGFLSARVKTKIDPKRPGEVLSMGFGFIEFGSKASADAAISTMNGFRLDGHELIVKASTKNTDIAEEQRRSDNLKKLGSNRTKIVIKNLPFQASKKDVRLLFAQYGQLKTVRVPKKFDNSSRGFAFAEFVTAKEAANAMEALTDTHLLGRRLVLDYVEEEAVDAEEQIKAIEKKIEQQSNRISLSKLMSTGRRKFNVEGPEEDNFA